MTFEQKYLRVPPPINLAERWIKRYHVNNDRSEIEPEIEKAAYELVPSLLPAADSETPPATFVVLHRGGDGAAYVNAYSWVWGNVIHCLTAAAAQPALDSPDSDPTHFVQLDRPWIGCVWELPALGHERSAWVRHILAPAEPDLDGYLADSLPEGWTGGPDG